MSEAISCATGGARRRCKPHCGSVEIVLGERFYQVNDPAAHLDVGDLDKGPVELKSFGTAAELDSESHRTILGKAAVGCQFLAWRILEKEGDGDAEYGGNRLQAAGTDAIGALFIFLDLLERDAEILAQLFLAHSEHIAAKPDPASHVNVDGIGFLLVFFCHFFPRRIFSAS